MSGKFIAFQMLGIVGSWCLFVGGVHSALCLFPLALTMTVSAVWTFIP